MTCMLLTRTTLTGRDGVAGLVFPVFSAQPAGKLPKPSSGKTVWLHLAPWPLEAGDHEPGQEKSLPPEVGVKNSESASFWGECLLR